jgi:hypothetical protein
MGTFASAPRGTKGGAGRWSTGGVGARAGRSRSDVLRAYGWDDTAPDYTALAAETALLAPRHLKVALFCYALNGMGDIMAALKLCKFLVRTAPSPIRNAVGNSVVLCIQDNHLEKAHLLMESWEKSDLDKVLLHGYTIRTDPKSVAEGYPGVEWTDLLPPFAGAPPDAILVGPPGTWGAETLRMSNLFPFANARTVFTFSEYDLESLKPSDFPLGLAPHSLGLLVSPSECLAKPRYVAESVLKVPADTRFAMGYVANAFGPRESVVPTLACVASFAEMVLDKHGSSELPNDQFHLVVNVSLVSPPKTVLEAASVAEDPGALNDWERQSKQAKIRIIAAAAAAGFVSVVIQDIGGREHKWPASASFRPKILYIRHDVWPLSHSHMLTLMKHGVSDVLVTGDQSVTDLISCATATDDKTIWYQALPWKLRFAEELAKHLHRPELASGEDAACGLIAVAPPASGTTSLLSSHSFFTNLTALARLTAALRSAASYSSGAEELDETEMYPAFQEFAYEVQGITSTSHLYLVVSLDYASGSTRLDHVVLTPERLFHVQQTYWNQIWLPRREQLVCLVYLGNGLQTGATGKDLLGRVLSPLTEALYPVIRLDDLPLNAHRLLPFGPFPTTVEAATVTYDADPITTHYVYLTVTAGIQDVDPASEAAVAERARTRTNVQWYINGGWTKKLGPSGGYPQHHR